MPVKNCTNLNTGFLALEFLAFILISTSSASLLLNLNVHLTVKLLQIRILLRAANLMAGELLQARHVVRQNGLVPYPLLAGFVLSGFLLLQLLITLDIVLDPVIDKRPIAVLDGLLDLRRRRVLLHPNGR